MKKYLSLVIIPVSLIATLAWPMTAAAQSGVIDGGGLDTAPLTESGEWNVIPDNAVKLDDEKLRLAFSGVTHRGQYRFLRQENNTFAFSETTRTDGTLTHKQGREILTGIWNVEGEQICYTYDRIWTYPVCFNIYKSGTCYYHAQRSSNGFPTSGVTARSTPSTQEPDCDALTS